MVVCGGSVMVVSWWFMVVCDVSLSWFRGGSWLFVVVRDVLFSKILQKKVM